MDTENETAAQAPPADAGKKDFPYNLTPRQLAGVLPDELPTGRRAARFEAALKLAADELRRLMGEHEQDFKITLNVWPTREDGTVGGCCSREIDAPDSPRHSDPDVVAHRRAYEDNRRAIQHSLMGSWDAKRGVIYAFESIFSIVEHAVHANDFREAREVLAGQMLVIEALDIMREVLGVEPEREATAGEGGGE